jgi:hypothetical protein
MHLSRSTGQSDNHLGGRGRYLLLVGLVSCSTKQIGDLQDPYNLRTRNWDLIGNFQLVLRLGKSVTTAWCCRRPVTQQKASGSS